MNPHWIEVLDRADDHAVVIAVTHDFELELFPAGDARLDQNLTDRAHRDSLRCEMRELVERRRNARAPAAENVGRANDARQANCFQHAHCFIERMRNSACRYGQTNFDHRFLELPAIFRGRNRLGVCADQFGRAGHPDEASLEQRHCNIECGLAAHRGQHGVGALALDDPCNNLGSERLDVRRVSEVGVRHDRGWIRIGEDDAVTLIAQDPTSLRAAVIEFAGLTNHDRSATDDQNAVDVGALWHQATPNSAAGSPAIRVGVPRRNIGRPRHDDGSFIMSSNTPNR